tara:strand:+ start:182 stop:376 length:195 start_codon:yes stop_codon:yes gene_type:complete
MTRCWQIELEFPDATKKKTFVYSDTGQDIEPRFKKHICMVKVLEEIDDPLSGSKSMRKKEDKFI